MMKIAIFHDYIGAIGGGEKLVLKSINYLYKSLGPCLRSGLYENITCN